MSFRTAFACCLTMGCLTVAAQKPAFHAKGIPVANVHLPSLKGQVVSAWEWTDSTGSNRLILAEGKETRSDAKVSSWGEDCEGGCTSKYLYAWQIRGKDSVLWSLTDFEKDCGADLVAAFTVASVRITDLDQDGVAETWFLYRTTCTTDVSPMQLKLIYHEGTQKLAIRGQGKPFRSHPEYKGGTYKADAGWSKLPAAYVAFAKKLWNQYVYDRD